MGQDWLKPPASNGFRPPPLLPPEAQRQQRAAKSAPNSPSAVPPPKRGIDALTDDILVAILTHLGAVDLARIGRALTDCSAVSKRLRQLSVNHRAWKKLYHIHFSYHNHTLSPSQEDYYNYFRECSHQELGAVKRETMLSKITSSLLKSQPQTGAFKCDYDPMTRSRDFRILIVGPPASGKSSLLLRFFTGEWSTSYTETMGASFASKKVMVDDLLIRISYVDAPGTERYMQVLDTFYKDMHAAIVVYSVTSKDSVPRMKSWAKTIREHPSTPKDLALVVVGTKCDGKRVVDSEAIATWCKEINVPMFETSAKTGDGVNELFANLVRQFRSQRK